MFKPQPAAYTIRFWMHGWGHGAADTTVFPDAFAAVQDFVAKMKIKYGEHADLVITSVEAKRS